MKMKFFFSLPVKSIILFLFFPLNFVVAQNLDWGLWSETGVTKEFNKWQFSSVLEIYTEQQSKKIDRISLINDARFNIINGLQAGVALMPMRKWKEDDSEWRLRHYYYLLGSFRYRSYSFSLRERIEITNYPVLSEDDNFEFVSKTWRNRIEISKDIAGIPFMVSGWVETFAPFNDQKPLLEEYRYAISCTYLSSGNYSIEGYLLYFQRRANDIFIFGLNCYLTI